MPHRVRGEDLAELIIWCKAYCKACGIQKSVDARPKPWAMSMSWHTGPSTATFKATQQPTVGTAKLLRSKVFEIASAQLTLNPKRPRGPRYDMIWYDRAYIVVQYGAYKTERRVIRWKTNLFDMSLCWEQIGKLWAGICDIIHAQSHTTPAQVHWGSFCLRRFSWCLLPSNRFNSF